MTVRMLYLMFGRLAGSMALMLRQEIGVLRRRHLRANAYAERWVRTAR